MPGTWLKPYEGKGALRGFLVSRVVFTGRRGPERGCLSVRSADWLLATALRQRAERHGHQAVLPVGFDGLNEGLDACGSGLASLFESSRAMAVQSSLLAAGPESLDARSKKKGAG